MNLWGDDLPALQALLAAPGTPFAAVPGGGAAILKAVRWSQFLLYITEQREHDESAPLEYLERPHVVARQRPYEFRAASSFFNGRLPAAAVAQLADAAAAPGNEERFLQVKALGGNAGKVRANSAGASAWPHRDAAMLMQIFDGSPGGAAGWVVGVRDAVLPAATGAEYLNYVACGLQEEQPEQQWVRYFGRHAARLQGLRQRFDPLGRLAGPCEDMDGGRDAPRPLPLL